VPIEIESEPVSIRVEALHILDNASHHTIQIGDFSVAAGERMAIVGTVGAADSMVLPAIAGFVQYQRGFIEIGGLDARDAIRFSDSSLIGYAGSTEIFAGTISENVRLGRSGISDADLRDALETVELWDEVLLLADGLNTRLQTRGFPLCEDQLPRLAIARAIVAHPRALLIDWALDALPSDLRYRIWDRLRAKTQPWTLLITTHDDKIIQQADKVFRLEEHS
jgi:ATP-binding cassette subfamily C protein CydC